MRTPDSTPSSPQVLGAFGLAAFDYFQAGWSPIPVVAARERKAPLVKGYTGYQDAWPSVSVIESWMRLFPGASIGLRLPKDIIGIDVDCYGGKHGRDTMRCAVDLFGPLPQTWISTSRTDGSGIHLYRIENEESTLWGNRLGADVETIRWCHRYVTVSPSVHYTYRKYEWWKPRRTAGWKLALDEFPSPGDIPFLPHRWARNYPRLTYNPIGTIEAGDPDPIISEFLGKYDPNSEEMSDLLQMTVRHWTAQIEDLERGSAHDTALAAIFAVVGDVYLGARGARMALHLVGASFLRAVKGRRSERAARGELRRATATAILKRRTEGTNGR